MLTSLASRGLLPGLRETWASGRLLNVPHRRRLAAGLRAQILLSRRCRCRCPAPTTLGKQPWPPLRPLGHSCCRGRGGGGWGRPAFSQATPGAHRGRSEDHAHSGPRCSEGLSRLLYWGPEGLQLGRFSSFLTFIYFCSVNGQRREALQRWTRKQALLLQVTLCLPKVARPLERIWNLRQIVKFKAGVHQALCDLGNVSNLSEPSCPHQ